MSLAQQIKTLEAEKAERDAKIQTISAERDQAKADLASATEENAKLKADIAAAQAEHDQAIASDQAAHGQAIAERDEKIKTLTAERDQAIVRADRAEKALANPGHKEASSAGTNPVPAGEAGGESGALWPQYYAITDPAQRRAFWLANEKALRAESVAATKG